MKLNKLYVLSFLIIVLYNFSCNPNGGGQNSIEDLRDDVLESIKLPTLIKVEATDANDYGDLLGRVKQVSYSAYDISNSKTMSITVNMSSNEWTRKFDETGKIIDLVIVDYQNTLQYPDWDKLAPDTIYESWEYDQNSRVAKYFSQRSRMKKYVTNRYDEDGQLLEKTSRNSTGRVFEILINTYDDNGRIIESISKEPEGRIDTKRLYKYDLKGRTEEFHRFALTDDLLSSKDISKYNRANQLIQRQEYIEISDNWWMKKRIKSNLGLIRETVNEYNAEGYEAKSITVRYDEKSPQRKIMQSTVVTYTYDSKGDNTLKRIEKDDGDVTKVSTSYNGNRKLLKEVYEFTPGKNSSKKQRYESVECDYDKLGNLIKEETYSSTSGKKSLKLNQYKYDSIGNWTECILIENGSPERISKQEIQYYETSTSTSDLLSTAEQSFNSDKYAESVQQYSAILNLKGQVMKGLYFNRGTSKFMLNDFRGAISDYSSELESNPNSIDSYYYRGIAAICVAKKDSGCADLSKAGELGHPDAYEIISKFCQ